MINVIQPCPFCGSTTLTVATDAKQTQTMIICTECSAEGPPQIVIGPPSESAFDRAIEKSKAAWNRRVKDKPRSYNQNPL
jgi:Lar family restriction alleviation protein